MTSQQTPSPWKDTHIHRRGGSVSGSRSTPHPVVPPTASPLPLMLNHLTGRVGPQGGGCWVGVSLRELAFSASASHPGPPSAGGGCRVRAPGPAAELGTGSQAWASVAWGARARRLLCSRVQVGIRGGSQTLSVDPCPAH